MTWIALAVLSGFIVAGGLGYGLDYALKTADTYRVDLTTGDGDFSAVTSGNTATSYQPDGFHLRITRAGGFRISGVIPPRPYTAAEVTATVAEVSSPAGASFGPWCFYDENKGYGVALASSGQVTIVYLENGWVTVIGRGQVAAWLPGQIRKLAIVCRLSRAGDTISAFVGGAKVAETAHRSLMPEIKATGFAGFVPKPASGPGEWTVTGFSRSEPGGS